MQSLPALALPWLSLVGTLVVWTAAVVGVLWKWKGGPLERDVAELKAGETGNPNRRAVRVDELNRVGEKLDGFTHAAEGRETRVRALEVTVRDHTNDIGHLREQTGRITTWMETCSRDTQEMKHEIIGFISKRTDEISRQVQEVEVKVAVTNERVEALRAVAANGRSSGGGLTRSD